MEEWVKNSMAYVHVSPQGVPDKWMMLQLHHAQIFPGAD